jgi:protein SCO1
MKSYKTNLLKYSYLFWILMFAPIAFAGDTASYPTSGVVEKIASDRHMATIHNQTIPGYMAEMTMDFPVKDTNELAGISPGDEIKFMLVVNKNDSWIENVRRTGHTDQVMTNTMQDMSTSDPELGTGDLLPDGILIAEDGRTIHFSDFRGSAVAFTFFYTRCPLPNYCPLMNRNFEAARNLISSFSNAPTNWEFLSISFDAQNDTPEALGNYAGAYRGTDSNHWLFAAATTNTLATLAPCLDLMVVHSDAGISHNLRTVILDTKGRIYQQFDGNQWTPQQLASAILAATRQ